MTPLVSVIIPLHNSASTIADALHSIRIQDGVTCEAIVVDDGSTDDGAARARECAARDDRVRVISQPNRGLAHARNAGIELARGAFLHFLDADDWLLPGGLSRMVSAAVGSGAAYGGSEWRDATGTPLNWSFTPSCPSVGISELLEYGRFQPVCQLVSRSALGELRFRDTWPGAEDHDLWLRLAERGVRWTAVEGDVCAYRLRPSSMSRDFLMMGSSLIGGTRESFARCRDAGAAAGVDLSPERERRVVDRIALDHASGALAVQDEASATELLRRLGRSDPIHADQAALSAFWMSPYAHCLPPRIWSDEEHTATAAALLHRLTRWWEALSKAELAERELASRALSALAELVPSEFQVAEAIAARFQPGDIAAVYGLGRDGRAVVQALFRRSVNVRVVDDALVPGSRVSVSGEPLTVWTLDEALRGARACVVPVQRDAPLLARLAPDVPAITWRATRRALAERSHQRIAELLRAPNGAGRAA